MRVDLHHVGNLSRCFKRKRRETLVCPLLSHIVKNAFAAIFVKLKMNSHDRPFTSFITSIHVKSELLYFCYNFTL
jgi:hypothetical protein